MFHRRRITATIAMFAVLAVGVPVVSASSPSSAGSPSVTASAKTFKNCTALHKVYPHGVGKKGAKDHVSGKSKKVTTFKVSNALYKANKKSDGDKDGIACEKR
jgi:hypothetical protein